jgi:micrococcal nuclease
MYTYKAKITRVVDGDTFDAEVDLGFGIVARHRFRVADIDTPETWRPINESEAAHGEKASDRAKALLEGKTLTLVTKKKSGIYGRYSAVVTLEDGRDFATVMIDEGFQKLDSY